MHTLAPFSNIAYFMLTGLVQRELECRSKGYPFASREIPQPVEGLNRVLPIPARYLSHSCGTCVQQIALSQAEGVRPYEIIEGPSTFRPS